MWDGKTVSVVFPAYNEEPNIEAAVSDFLSVVYHDIPVVDQILVINNNSNDRTRELALAAGAEVVDETKQGYGNAL